VKVLTAFLAAALLAAASWGQSIPEPPAPAVPVAAPEIAPPVPAPVAPRAAIALGGVRPETSALLLAGGEGGDL
jgi:hypothetical protein